MNESPKPPDECRSCGIASDTCRRYGTPEAPCCNECTHGAVPAADEDRERLAAAIHSFFGGSPRSTWPHDSAYDPSGLADYILRAGVSPFTGDDRLREALTECERHLALSAGSGFGGSTTSRLLAKVRAALSTGASDTEKPCVHLDPDQMYRK